MEFPRPMLAPGKFLAQAASAGSGFISNLGVTDNAADAVLAMTPAMLLKGCIAQTADLTADRTYTFPLGTELDTAIPNMNIGDALTFVVIAAHVGAFDIVLTEDTGVTLVGTQPDIAEGTSRLVVLKKTGVATYLAY